MHILESISDTHEIVLFQIHKIFDGVQLIFQGANIWILGVLGGGTDHCPCDGSQGV